MAAVERNMYAYRQRCALLHSTTVHCTVLGNVCALGSQVPLCVEFAVVVGLHSD